MKLSEVHPDDIQVVSSPGKDQAGPLKVSDLHPDDFHVVSLPPPVAAKPEGVDVGGIANAAMRGTAQGATFGFADELAAGGSGLIDYVKGKMGLRGDISLPDAYHTERDAIRNADAKAHEAHPWVYNTGQVAGGLATAVAPGAGFLNVGRGAGLVEAAGKGAMIGGISGAGNAKEITDVPAEAGKGALIGAAAGGALNLGGKAVGAVVDKLRPAAVGSVLLNAPEAALQRYIDNPEAVNAARSRADIVQQEFLPRIEALKGDVIQGSAASRAVLAAEGHTVPGSQIADLLDQKAQTIIDRSEGVMDDPSKVAAVKWLQDLSAKYRPPPPEGGIGPVRELTLSTNRVKDLLQTIDQTTEYSTGPGEFSRIDDLIKRDIRSKTDDILKSSSAAYAQQMKHVHEDTMILKEVAELAKSPQGFDNLLKRTQRGNTPHLLDAIRSFDERTGGGLLEELQNSAAKDALARGAMNGSRNVNLHGGIGETVGQAIGGPIGRFIGKGVGLLGGATVDKYGPGMAKGLMDNASAAQSFLDSSPGVQALAIPAQRALQAAGDSNKAAAVINSLEADNNQRKRDAIKRRLGE